MTLISRPANRIIGGRKGEGDGPGPGMLGASTLVGSLVVNGVGESLGEIREIMLDVNTGRIAYAVLELSGFIDLCGKLFPVPWMALTFDADNRCFILNVDKRRLRDAPSFQKDRWPCMGQPDWENAVHRFYSAEPFWRYHA
jgi:sporulation protein YlmC with PRC-barrel domain